jgi:16S rRNA processing protein RimM
MTPEHVNDSEKREPAATGENRYHHRNRRVIIPDGVMAVGLIAGVHGLRGELKVEPHTDFPERFDVGKTVLMGTDLAEVKILSSRPHKELYLVRLEGVNDRSTAESLRGNWLFIPEVDATALEEDTFWIHDLVGMEVVDRSGRTLGSVHNIMATGANNVYLITPAEGINRGREILLPAIADVVQSVDADQRRIVVELIPGLLADEEDDQAAG